MSALETEGHLDDRSNISDDGKTITAKLGIAEFKDMLAPKIKKAKEDNRSK